MGGLILPEIFDNLLLANVGQHGRLFAEAPVDRSIGDDGLGYVGGGVWLVPSE